MSEQSEFYRLGCTFLERALNIVTEETAKNIGKRLELASRGTWIPTSGHGDTNMLAAILNMMPSGVKDFAVRNQMPVAKPGAERIYDFRDIVKPQKST